MSNEPLAPFHPPAGLSFAFAAAPGTLALWFVVFALVVWGLYTVVAIYHWIKYSHAAAVAYPAITLHLCVSAILALYALSGLAGLI